MMNPKRRHILLFLMTLLLAMACNTPYEYELPAPAEDNDYLTLRFMPPTTRNTVEDNEYESFMQHLDVIIYRRTDDSYTAFHYERINVSDTPTGVATIHKTKNDFEEGVGYKFFVIANSTLPTSTYQPDGTLIGYNDFLKLDQTDEYIHLSGIEFGVHGSIYPQAFLMDGIAYLGTSEPATAGDVVINDGEANDEVMLKVTLRRATAKFVITFNPGDKVTFTPELMALSQGYMLRNMPIRTTLSAEGGYPDNDGGENPYWKSPTISQTPYFELISTTDDNGVINNKIRITAYCYSHAWNSDDVFERGTTLVVMLPMLYQETEGSDPIKHINNYYQISICKKEAEGATNDHIIKRNTYYDLTINLNAPGSEDFTQPEDIKEIYYFAAPWEIVDMNVTGENPVKYLKVNKEKLYMHNTADDLQTLYFSSSSPVTITLDGNAYYYNKYNVKTEITGNAGNISASTAEGAVSGNISVHSDIPTNNTIRYFRLKVTNEDGLTEYVDVEQYPLIYITNNLPWYSYRDDYYYRTGEGHTFGDNTSNETTAGDQPTTYRYPGDHIVSIYQINSVDTDTKKVTYTYTSQTPSNNHGFTVSKVRGNASGNNYNYNILYYYFDREQKREWVGSWWNGSYNTWYEWSMKTSQCETHNVRNYHVKMMATSGDYILGRPRLDEYGYTAGDEENSKLVSPSFVIASRLGAVLSTYSGLGSMSNEKKLIAFADHCKNYVEVDDVNDDKKDPVVVADNWRLPTEAELKIIINIQGESGKNADAIDYLLNGAYYMSASGPVYNPKNADGTEELANPKDATDVAIRCVRDAFDDSDN